MTGLFKSRTMRQEDAENEGNMEFNLNDEFEKLSLKFFRVDTNFIDYMKSPHTMSLQNSNFIKIENNRERIL